VCSTSSPPRLMIPKVEFVGSEEDSSGPPDRDQRDRLCSFLDKGGRLAGMMSGKFGGGPMGPDSDPEGEEEPPPPHHDEDSGDMDTHSSGMPHPLSHQLPPGLQQSFVPYPQTTTHVAAAVAHHIASSFPPGPSGAWGGEGWGGGVSG
jgi:hypothetical protein